MRKLVALTVLLVLSFLPFSKAFADDATGITLEKEVRAMAELGVMKGYSEGVFRPHEKVTRAQFAAFIARALELPDGPHVFADVEKDYTLAKEINAAAASKIINGYPDTTFKPDKLITRGQIALMINNALNYMKVEPKTPDVTFADQNSLSPAAKIAVSNMVGHKITSGYKEGNRYFFKPDQTATRAEAAAFIYRMLQILPEDVKDGYRIATVGAGGKLSYLDASYSTFEEADKALQNTATQVIVKDGKIIKMSSGIAFTTPKGSQITTLYSKLPFTNANVYGGVEQTNEMEYVTSDAEKVTVKVAGQTVYVKHSEVTLFPSQGISARTYYTKNENGDLLLVRYDHVNKEEISTSTVGKAPSAFAVKGIYYSWDGVTFTDKNGKNIGTYYQYFNMLPLRTTTKYTAAELDQVIMRNLEVKESNYKSNPDSNKLYKDATKKSKLIGLGKKLKEIEAEHNINALLILGMAFSESDYGMSNGAQQRNNLFGLGAHTDLNGMSKSFAAPEESIKYLVTAINNEYLFLDGNRFSKYAVLGGKASGGMLGNKARGMNVRYADDPYWGQIIAGHVYLMDKALGGKDFQNNAKPYQLYETNQWVNVRSSAEVKGNDNLLFVYPRAGYAVAALEQNNGWTKVLSDVKTKDLHAYINNEYLRPMAIAK